MGEAHHVALSQDCFPLVGGAHGWLLEVYQRWSTNVTFLTRKYSEDATQRAAEEAFDRQRHGTLAIERRLNPVTDLDVLSAASWRDVSRNRSAILAEAGGAGRLVVHSVRAFPEGVWARAAQMTPRRRIDLVTYAHGEEVLVAQSSGQLRAMAKHVYERSALVVANSENTKALVLGLAPAAAVAVAFPGVDAGRFAVPAAEASAYRARWGWPSGSIVLCTVSRMEKRKNQDAVIRCVGRLRAEGLPVVYVCAGDGEERERLETLARATGIPDAVLFPGRVTEDEKRLIFAACDLHVMPSVQVGAMIEGFGIVFLEAAAAGKPSVAGRVGGQPEAVKHGVTGLVIDGGDDAELAGAVRALCLGADLRREMGAAALLWARQNDWRHCVARIHGLVESAECA